MNWDDIKVFLEIARSERLNIAAKRLAMDASTLSRRLHKLEEQLATKLFSRTTEGHVLTLDGEKLLQFARRMELNANQAFTHIKEHNPLDSGRVRIGVTEAFGSFFIAPHLGDFQEKYPNIEIELLHFARNIKISRNEADIAVAVDKPKNTSTIISKLCDYQLQLYAHPSYLTKVMGKIDLAQLASYRWISYVDNLLYTEQLAYLKDLNPNIKPHFQSTSITSQYSAIKSGLGIGILPCFLAEQDASLIKVCAEEVKLTRSLYLVTHPESKRLSHVNSVWQYLRALTEKHQRLLIPE
ncbi:LysR family transcriptional regulator [Litorilituus sediminis]|uniref:LysR family transcriptional regulator n=1 Tax=Litorilituus sediminis TaxID=718192 RepID=A0A4P6P6Y2_9GAMM|nr:LysR family transcriptional regulator [Litorilituus sediminis]QBG35165.1 LysR family transcriptional regulator [Litorilituus sediminis]